MSPRAIGVPPAGDVWGWRRARAAAGRAACARRKSETLEAFQALEEGRVERLDGRTPVPPSKGRLGRRQSSPSLPREVSPGCLLLPHFPLFPVWVREVSLHYRLPLCIRVQLLQYFPSGELPDQAVSQPSSHLISLLAVPHKCIFAPKRTFCSLSPVSLGPAALLAP